MVSTPPAHRYIELDVLRIIAIVMMVIYHAAYDLETFYDWNIGVLDNGWWYFARATASLFLLLVGCSFAISWHRQRNRYPDHHFAAQYRKYFLRGLGILLCGLLVSVVTYVFDDQTYVRFGILHLIGVSILLLPFFARLKEGNIVPAVLIILIGRTMTVIPDATSLLLPFGIVPEGFISVDYYPLFPWFGMVLIGYGIGYLLYVGSSASSASLVSSHAPRRGALWLTWSGRHALIVYLIHQPIILGILGFLGFLGILH